MSVLEEVAAALQAGELAPEAVLDSLAARLGDLLAARLHALQGAAVPDAADDATVVHPRRSTATADAAAEPDPDATVVQPGGAPRAAVDDDATVVQPGSSPLSASERTGTAQPTVSQIDSLSADS